MPPSIRPFVPIALYEGMIDALPAGLLVFRLDEFDDPRSLRLLYANSKAADYLGFDFHAALGQTLPEFLPGLFETDLPERYAEVARTGKGQDLGDVRYGDDVVREGIYAICAYGLPDQSVGLMFEDVTTARAEEDRRLREVTGLADAAFEGILLSERGRVVLANQAAADLLGYAREELMGMDVLDLVAEGSREEVRAHLATERAEPSEAEMRRKDGRAVPVDLRGRTVEYAGRTVHAMALRDLTERVRALREVHALREAEAALRASETQFRLLTETAADVIVTIGTDSLIRYVNPAVEGVFGYAPEELLGADLTRLMPEGLRALHKAGMARYLETGEKRLHWGHVEVPGLRRDGTPIPLAVSFGEYVRDGERLFTGFLRDVSAQRATEDALRASEAEFRLLTDTMPQVIWTAAADGAPDYYNERWYAYTGMPRPGEPGGDPLPTNWGDYLHPDDRDAAFGEFARAAATGTPFEMEYRFRRHDGAYRWFLGRALPLRDDAGEVARWFGSATDIHDFRLAQEELRESEERFRTMADSAPVFIWLAGPDRQRTWFNAEWLRFTGRALEDELGDGWAEGLHPDDRPRFLDAYAATLDRHEVFEMEYRLRRHDGQYRWVLARGTPRFGPDGAFLGYIGTCLDIHERKAAARVLEEKVAERTAEARAAAERLDAVLNGTSDMIAAIDTDYRVIAFNRPLDDAIEAVIGKRLAVGMTAEDLLPDQPEEWAKSRADWERALKGEAYTKREMNDYPGLGLRAFETYYSPIRSADGAVTGAVSVTRDVTEREQAARAVEAFAGDLRQLHAVTTADHDSTEALLEDYLRAGCAILGLPLGAVVETDEAAGTWRVRAGRAPEGVTLPPGGDLEGTTTGLVLRRRATLAVADTEAVEDEAERGSLAVAALGVRSYVGTPIYAGNEVVGVIGFASPEPRAQPLAPHEVEIVEILAELVGHAIAVERAQRAEREADARYRTVVEALDEGIILQDADARIVAFNDAAARMLGRSAEELMGRTPADPGFETIRPDGAPFPGEEYPAPVALRTGEPQRNVLMGVRLPDDGLRWITCNAVPLRESEAPGAPPTGVVSSFTDVTPIVEAEEALRQRQRELEERNAELEQFAYVASHDLQEPLRTVASFLQLLERRYAAQLDDRAREYIAFAVDGSRRMQALIQGLLAYSRVGTRGRPFEEVDAAAVLDDVLVDLGPAAMEAGAKVEAGPLPTVVADPTQLHQLLLNLVGNALKFRAPDRPPRVEVAAKRAREHGRPVWRFTVADNGIGLDPKYAERVVQLFQRLHTRDEYPGTGIGLALCKKIVERHGGTLSYAPGADGGTTFTFTLPVRAPGLDAPASEPAPEPAAEPAVAASRPE